MTAAMISAMRVEEIKLDMPWGHVAGKAWGSREASRVLVVHGQLDNAGSFDRLIPLLPDSFYYVVIDLPGHGFSSPLPLGIQLDYLNYVFSIRLVLDALKWESCLYIGHSFGAQLGVFCSILYPGRISRMVCLDGFIPNPVEPDGLVEAIRRVQDNALNANAAKSAPLYTKDEILYALRSRRNFPLNSQAAEALFVRATTKVGELYKYNRDLRLRSFPPIPFFGFAQYIELAKHLKIPGLIVLAEFSWFADHRYKKSIEMLQESTGGKYTVVKVRGNHDVHNNNPELVAPHVKAFFCGAGNSKL